MTKSENFIIAIDGPAASGKGTLARNLAQALNFAHMDTGALYRAVAHEVLESGHDPENEAHGLQACAALQEKLGAQGTEALANPALRTEETGQGASKVAAIGRVREALLAIQRDFANNPGNGYAGAVLDGRDIGTVVCPDAPLKLFVTANEEERAKRRMKELHSKGIDATYRAVLADMRARDARDSGREAAPLKPADDAIVLDSTGLSEDQVLAKALDLVAQKRS